MTPQASYFPLLDALRGMAALVVVLRHTGYLWGGLVLPHSYLAVDLFFLLSGVVVANAYEHRLRAGLTVARFSLIRLIRIYPLYALGSMLGLAPVLAALAGLAPQPVQGPLALALASALLLLPDLAEPALFPLNPPAWSLFFELGANLVYAALLPHLGKRMLWLIVAACAAGLALVLLADPGAGLHGGYTPATLLTGGLRVGFGFFAGVLLWRAHLGRNPARPVRAPGGRAWQGAAGWLPVALAAALLLARPAAPLAPWFDLGAVLLAFPALLYCAMQHGAMQGGLSARACAWLGALSYPLYVLHVPLARLVNGVLEKGLQVDVAASFPCAGLGFMALLLAACGLLERHVDAPLRRRLMARLARTPGQAAPLRPAPP